MSPDNLNMVITHTYCGKCFRLRRHTLGDCPCLSRQLHDPRIFGTSEVGSEPVPQPPSKRFKGGVGTPHGDVSFHSEHEAARDYIWDAVSEKLDRDNGSGFTSGNGEVKK